MENTKDLIKEIKDNLSQVSSSQKDEIRVMKAMMNDSSYEIELYGSDGVKDTYSPFKDSREMLSNILVNTTKISKDEAVKLSENYEFKKSDAETLVRISKEFVNTYLHTGRKLPLGGHERSNISLSLKEVKETVRMYPKKVGVNPDGSDKYEKVQTSIPSYEAIKVIAPCPKWIRKK